MTDYPQGALSCDPPPLLCASHSVGLFREIAALVAADTLWVVGRSDPRDAKGVYGLWGYSLAPEAADADTKAVSSNKWECFEMVRVCWCLRTVYCLWAWHPIAPSSC